jgi:hypothetical protein
MKARGAQTIQTDLFGYWDPAIHAVALADIAK